VDVSTGDVASLDVPGLPADVSEMAVVSPTKLALIGGSPCEALAVFMVDLGGGGEGGAAASVAKLRDSWTADERIDPDYLSLPKAVEYPTDSGKTAHAFFYPPANKDFEGPEGGEKPPLLVKIHGGPTAGTSTTFRLGINFWTSRGFAVLDVDYGGSQG
jgi:dipeptidyl aminopeptidase/acylaminoacyl peptidase